MVIWKQVVIGFLVVGLGAFTGISQAEEQTLEDPTAASSPSRRSAAPAEKAKGGMTAEETAKAMEEMNKMTEAVMGPMMGQMMESMIRGMTKVMAEPETAQNLATFMRTYYLALIDRGFTEEEAMRIVTSTRLPSLGGMQQ